MKMNSIARKLLALCMTVLMLVSMAVPAFASELEGAQPPEGEGQQSIEQQIIPAQDTEPEHVHSHQAAVTTPASCTAEGVMTYTCACGDTYTAAIPVAEHTYGEASNVAPGCETEGSVSAACTVCGFVNTQVVPAAGHSYGEATTVAPTCEAEGSVSAACTVCGFVNTEVIPAAGHSYGEPVVVAATCTADGSKAYTCAVCGNVYTEVIPAAHTYAEAVVTPSTCTADGSWVYTCTVEGCGNVYTETIPAAHTYGEAVVVEPTCTAEGSRTYTCTVEGCGNVYTEIIPAAGHSYVDMVCSVCGAVQCSWQPDCIAAEHEEGCLKGSVDKVNALLVQLPLADTVTAENFEAVKALMDEIRAVDDAHRLAWLGTDYEMYVWNILQADANYVELYDIIANGVMMLDVADPEAKIGENEFATLAEAIAYANTNGGTVTVMKDVILTGPLTVTGSMVLDLNGNTISQTQVQTGNYQMILNDGALAIQDSVGNGKISYTDSGSGGNYVSNTITNRGTLTLYGGTIENLSSETVGKNGYPYVIDSSIWGSAAAVNTNIAGGRLYSAGYSAIRLRADSSKPVNVTVTAGEIIGTIEVQNSSTGDNVGNLSITGGSISNHATANAIYIFGNNSSNLDVSITGGNFAGNVVLKNTIKNSKFISGGTFNSDVSTLLADGYTLQDNGNGTYSPVPPTPVAQVGEAQYTSLQEAINNANGSTVTLLDNIELTESVTIPAGAAVTLDLNGKRITGTPAAASAYAVINNNGSLTINATGGGAIECNHTLAGSTAYAVNTITNCGALTINGGTIQSTSTASNQIGYAIDNNSTVRNAVLTVNGGSITVSGSSYYDGIRQFCNSESNENSVTIAGGSVSTIWLQNPSDGSGKNANDVKGSVSISNGSVSKIYLEPSAAFHASISGGSIGSVAYNEPDTNNAARNLTAFITGGTFTSADSVDPDMLKTGYTLEANGDGTYSPVPPNPVASVTSGETTTEYTDLSKAFAEAPSGSTITLLDNIELTEGVTIPAGASVTLELNGKTISQTKAQTENYQMILNDGNLVIQDSVGGGKISYTDSGSGGNYVSNTITNRGTLTLYSGTIENLSSATVGKNGYPYVIDSSIWGSAAAVNTNIAGGRLYSAGYSAIRLRADSSKPVNVNVSAGEIIGTIEVQNSSSGDNAGKLSITGGSISNNATSNAIFIFGNNSSNLEASITGGTFTGNVVLKNTIKDSKFISGGSFAAANVNDSLRSLLEDGYTLEQNADGTYSPAPDGSKPVKMGTELYATLSEAVAVAQPGATIELVGNVTETDVVLIAKSLTINGNGHSITSSASRVIRVTTGGVSLTMNGVNVVSNAVRVGTNDIRGISIDANTSNVQLSLTNCSVDFTDPSASDWAYGVNVSGNSSGHTVNISGGSYEGANVINVWGSGHSITVSGAALNCLYGYNDAYHGACVSLSSNESNPASGNTFNVTGCTFNGNHAEALIVGNSTLNASGNTDNTKYAVAKLGNTYCYSLAEAIEKAQPDDTVTLIDNIVLSEDLLVGKNISIDPNDHGISSNGGKISVADNVTLTVNGDYSDEQLAAFRQLCADGMCVYRGSIKVTKGHTGGTATCTEKAICGVCSQPYGEIDPDNHALVYTGKDNTITETCANGCDHSATAKLELDSSVSTVYTGSEIKALKVTYSENWMTEKDLTVSYKDNIAIGKATGSIEKVNKDDSKATATAQFDITRATYSLTVNNYRYVRGSGYPLSFTSNVPYSADNTVTKLLIYRANGTPVMEVPAAHFVLSANSSGMTVITLSPTVMNALDSLNYELYASFTNGDAKGAFRVLLPLIFPMTGDDAQTLLLLCLTFVALGTAGVTLFIIRRKSKGNRYNGRH